MKYFYFILILFIGCSTKKQSLAGKYNLHCVDLDYYSLEVYRNKKFTYNYIGHPIHSTKVGNWKLKGDTLTLFATDKVFKRFKLKNKLLCEVLTIEDDTLFCNHCLRKDND